MVMSCIAADVRGIVEKARETADVLADVIQDTKTRGEHQIERVDHLLALAVGRTDATTEYLMRTV
jgi:hypothetical protein